MGCSVRIGIDDCLGTEGRNVLINVSMALRSGLHSKTSHPGPLCSSPLLKTEPWGFSGFKILVISHTGSRTSAGHSVFLSLSFLPYALSTYLRFESLERDSASDPVHLDLTVTLDIYLPCSFVGAQPF